MKPYKIFIYLFPILIIGYFIFAYDKTADDVITDKQEADPISFFDKNEKSDVQIDKNVTLNTEKIDRKLTTVKKFKDLKLENYLKREVELALQRGIITDEQIPDFQSERKAIYIQKQRRLEDENTELLDE